MVQFRVKALNQMQRPDDLDLLMKVTDRRGWVAISALGVAVAAVIVWSFAGNTPSQIKGVGQITDGDGIYEMQSEYQGLITSVAAQPGDQVAEGDLILDISTENGDQQVVALFPGVVAGLQVKAGNVAEFGQNLYLLDRDSSDESGPSAIVFISADEAASVAPGMKVSLALDSVPSSVFGVLLGTVTTVNPYPLDEQEILTLTNDVSFSAPVRDGKGLIYINVAFEMDPSTTSGLKWSTGDGPPFKIPASSKATAVISQGNTRPIDLVFGR
jgi:pyruvate/2-oxoglutarate dehydrogenase complex dihydrolipoamide acyltransferase (E2) component